MFLLVPQLFDFSFIEYVPQMVQFSLNVFILDCILTQFYNLMFKLTLKNVTFTNYLPLRLLLATDVWYTLHQWKGVIMGLCTSTPSVERCIELDDSIKCHKKRDRKASKLRSSEPIEFVPRASHPCLKTIDS